MAWPGVAPPIRKNTSCTDVGSAGLLLCECRLPTCNSTGELTVPASNNSPESFTPGTSATFIVATPPVGTSVGKPRPSTTVSARFTLIVLSR